MSTRTKCTTSVLVGSLFGRVREMGCVRESRRERERERGGERDLVKKQTL